MGQKSPIAEPDKVAMRAIHGAELAKGRSSQDIVEELSQKYHRSARQIQRYLRLNSAIDMPKRELRNHSTLLKQQREVEHAEKLKACATELEAQVRVPQPADAGTWEPSTSASARDFVQSGQRSTGSVRVHSWNPAHPESLTLPVDSDLYLPYLRHHLPEQDLWDGIEAWRTATAAYIVDCQEGFLALVRHIEQQTRQQLMPESEWPQTGIFWTFATQLFRHYSMLTAFSGAVGLSAGKYVVGEAESSKLPDQGSVFQLWHGSTGIACHTSRETLEDWTDIHRNFMKDASRQRDVVALGRRLEVLENKAEKLRMRLRMEVERGMFDGGRCELCPSSRPLSANL